MDVEDIRWQQRFENYSKAFSNLQNGVQLAKEKKLSELEGQGLIQAFEFTFELAWKTLKDYLEFNSVQATFPRDVIKNAFQYTIIDDGDLWMDMLEKRNLMAHTYDETKAQLAQELIITKYYKQFEQLYHWFNRKLNEK
ncbi:MAG: nucleotidyltransferase substrate binding protein [Bacteroidales bacterium]|nr:nucleotidyltransferase substrate binding protein [Bacteroidales bacterium]